MMKNGILKMRALKRYATVAVCCLLPRRIKPFFLRALGHCVANGARIGFSLVVVERMHLEAGSRIGALNFIKLRRLVMRRAAYIGTTNIISGNFSLRLGYQAAVGNRNLINRGPGEPDEYASQLWLDTWSKITASHYVNVAASIVMGEYSTVAGSGTQLWTHGFVHMRTGLGRAEVRGKIKIGNNVYIGSQCCLNPGIRIVHGVAIGSHSSVAKSLLQPGLYVSQPLRYIPITPEERLSGLQPLPTSQETTLRYWRNLDAD